jgi:quinol monooxygenase YgiN
MTKKKTDVIVLATARAQPGKEAALEQALREAAGPTRKQPGCVEFTLFRAAGDPSTITGFERWASEEDHQRHLSGAHIKTLVSRFAGILAGPPTIVSYEAIDE